MRDLMKWTENMSVFNAMVIEDLERKLKFWRTVGICGIIIAPMFLIAVGVLLTYGWLWGVN